MYNWLTTTIIGTATDKIRGPYGLFLQRLPGIARNGLGLIVLLIVLLIGLPALAEDRVTIALADFHQEVLTTRDGLPHNSINAIAQTPEGFLWFATWEGLVRFNGRRFRLFERGSETGLPDSGLRHLSTTDGGHLLVAGARGGVSLFDGHEWRAMPPAPAMITHALLSDDSRLWLATEGGGLIERRRVAIDQWQEITHLPGSSVNVVISHAERVWVGTSNGLKQLNPVDGALINQFNGLPSGPVFSLAIDSRDRLLVGTEQGLFVNTTVGFEPLNDGLAGVAISTVLVEPEGSIWLGTVNRGLFRWSDLGLEMLDTSAGLPNNRVLAIHRDSEDSLWIGTNGGLLRLREAPFVTATRSDGLAGDYVRSVLPTPQGLVVATSEGVSQQQDNRFIELTDRDSPLGLSTLSLGYQNPGTLLLGTHTEGLLVWRDNQIIHRFDRDHGLPSNEVRAVAVDDEIIWAGTAVGLARIQNDEIAVFGVADGLPGDYVIALQIDLDRRLWIGTGTGLALFDGEDFQIIPIRQHDQAQYAFGITPDPDLQFLWVSTDRGLIRVDIESLDTALIGRTAGLPIDKLFQVVADSADNLWLSSNRGVIRISREQAQAVASGQQQTLDLEIYGEGDGMLSAQANGGSNPAAVWYGGRVWVATAKGLTSVDPNRLTRYAETPVPVVIESFQADRASFPLTQSPIVPAGTNRVVIQYAGLGYIMPQRIRYRTLLQPFDQQWIERDQQSIAEYTNLPPGKYQFQVEASYPQGDWIGESASLSFQIEPLFWQRRISWLMAAGLIAIAFGLSIRLRLRRLRIQAVNLRQQVEQKTDALKRQAEDFAHQARVDQLTGLANRRAFDEWLASEFRTTVERGQILSLAVMDIDHFKQVNDRWTHIAGDKVICKIADVLKQHTRSADQAARWGGEEFTLLFSGTAERDAAAICERIRQAIASLDLGEITNDRSITASFGVCDSSNVNNYEDLLRHADHALYLAKQNGRNRVVIYADT